MVIRILADGQYRVDPQHPADIAAIAKFDDELLRELETDDATGFQHTLEHLIERVHGAGSLVPVEELLPSEVIVPSADMTLAETKQLLAALN